MYKEYEKIIQEKIKSKEAEIKELERQIEVINQDKSFIETKRKKELKELFIKKLQEDLILLEKELDNLNKSLTNIESISSLLDKDINLDKSDLDLFDRQIVHNETKVIEKQEDLIMVHKTKFFPIGGVMYTPRETKATKTSKFKCNEKEYKYEYEVGNDTLHFCLNSPVSDHEYGSWSDRPYAILVPFDKVNKENLLRAHPEDTYFLNKVVLPEGSIILCPKSEKEIARKQNPNVKVVGYDETITLDEAIYCTLMYKGYKLKVVDKHGWNNYDKTSDYENFLKIKEKDSIIDKDDAHYYSHDRLKALLYQLSKEIIAISKTIIENDLFLDINVDELCYGVYDSCFIKIDDIEYFFLQFQKDLLESGLHVVSSYIEDDLKCLYDMINKSKNTDGNISSTVPLFIKEYLINTLISYEYIKREANKLEGEPPYQP